MLLPSQKPSSSYLHLKFFHVTNQLHHSLVVHPLLRKILDLPLQIPILGALMLKTLDMSSPTGWHSSFPLLLKPRFFKFQVDKKWSKIKNQHVNVVPLNRYLFIYYIMTMVIVFSLFSHSQMKYITTTCLRQGSTCL